MDDVDVIDEEYFFEGRMIISETDLKGVITYANRKFCEISGYSAEELVGKPHNIIRHPDMPKAAFEGLWKTIKGGQPWHGIVKNRRKDGKYYWVETNIQASLDTQGNTIGYIAARKPASRKDIADAKTKYEKMLLQERE